MSDHPTIRTDGPNPTDPPDRGVDQQWLEGSLPSLAQDRSVLAWLHQSTQLSQAATGYLCDALLEWALLGLAWPEEAEPPGGPHGDHLEVLRGITERLLLRIAVAQPRSAKLDLARIGRLLNQAIWCQIDPEGLRHSQGRGLLQPMPLPVGPSALVTFGERPV